MLASWIPIPQKYANPDSRDHQPKVEKKNFFTLKPQIRTVEKGEILKISRSLHGSSSFSIKISEKKKKII